MSLTETIAGDVVTDSRPTVSDVPVNDDVLLRVSYGDEQCKSPAKTRTVEDAMRSQGRAKAPRAPTSQTAIWPPSSRWLVRRLAH